MTSKELSDKLGIQHRDINRKIDCISRYLPDDIVKSTYTTSRQQTYDCFTLSSSGLKFVIMSLNGLEEIKAKLASGLDVYDCLSLKVKPKKVCYVYGLSDNKHIKLGMANDVDIRLKTTLTYSPHSEELFRIPLNSRDDAAGLEKRLHHHFRCEAVGGEWFNISLEDVVNFLGEDYEISFK